MDQWLSSYSTTSSVYRPCGSSFDLSLPDDHSMISNGSFSSTWDEFGTFGLESCSTRQLESYHLSSLEHPIDTFVGGTGLELVPWIPNTSTSTSQDVVPFTHPVQSPKSGRKRRTRIPQDECDYLDLLMEAYPGCVTKISEMFNKRFLPKKKTSTIGARIRRRQREKEQGLEDTSRGKITRSASTKNLRVWSDTEVYLP